MRLLLTPLIAFVLSIGPGPDSGVQRLESEAGSAIQPAIVGQPSWDRIDEYIGIDRELSFSVDVTAYSSTYDQCDRDPFITASNTQVRVGIVALSRDLLQRYNPDAPFTWGDHVYLEGIGEFIVEDSMNARFSRRVDIWFPERVTAKNWGVHKSRLIIPPHADLFLGKSAPRRDI